MKTTTEIATENCRRQLGGLKQMGEVRPYSRNSAGGKAIRLFDSQCRRTANGHWVDIAPNLKAAVAAKRPVWAFLSAWNPRRTRLAPARPRD